MKTLIAATTLSVMMAAGGVLAQGYDANVPVGTPGSDPSVITPSTNHESATGYDASNGITVDTNTTGSISDNSNCTPASGANPATLPTELQAPAVQSCNPR